MDLDRFWSIVDSVKDSPEPESAVENELRKLSPEELVSFQGHMDAMRDQAYRWDLWGAAYVLQGGCSDDGFEYFRLGLISKGRAVYEKVLSAPDSLADVEGIDEDGLDGELLGYAAMKVYKDTTGKEMSLPPYSSKEPAGEEWDFDDESQWALRLPKLAAKASACCDCCEHSEPAQRPSGEASRPQNKPWWKFW